MYWTLKSIPELQDLPPRQRRLIWNSARTKRREQSGFFARMLYFWALLLAIKFVKQIHTWNAGQLVGIIAGVLFVAAIYHQWRISKLRPLTWQFIPGLCPRCGEKVSAGSTSCPKCRATIPAQPVPCDRPLTLNPPPQDGMYWTRKSIPELRDLPKEERDRIWNLVWKKAGSRWEILLSVLLMGMVPIVIIDAVGWFNMPTAIRVLFVVMVLLVVHFSYFQWQASILRPLMWEHIPGMCPRCGYNLRATPERCPECGTRAPPIADVTGPS